MGLRPASCYRDFERPYTRTAIKVHRKNYIGATPALRIRQFNMGNPLRKYKRILDLCVDRDVQVRDNAIEAMRVHMVRHLNEEVGKENYFMRVRVYPSHILRENKQAQGAGADRVSQGMKHAFGRAIGRAARVHKGQVICSVLVDEEHVDAASKLMLQARNKLPCKVFVKDHANIASIGTMPKKVREAKLAAIAAEKEKKEDEEKAEGEEEEGEGKEGEEKAEGKDEKGREGKPEEKGKDAKDKGGSGKDKGADKGDKKEDKKGKKK